MKAGFYLIYSHTKLKEIARLHGRYVVDNERRAVFFNWSCSGFTLHFRGKHLSVKLLCMGDKIAPGPAVPFPETDYPCFGITLDDGELTLRTECSEGERVYELFSSDDCEEHSLRFIKLSENARGKIGINEIEIDGVILPPPEEKKLTVEFIGDSITCGFGNEAECSSPVFRTREENAWLSHVSLASRELGLEWNIIAESGICAVRPEHPLFDTRAMEEIYAYTDELYDSKTGRPLEVWEFAANPKDIIVINLGTNDANQFLWYTDYTKTEQMMSWFRNGYRRFLESVRHLNGKHTLIVCTLGSMDYFLYNAICETVEAYIADSGDQRVRLFPYIGINPITEGYGAVGHPSAKTHRRMAKELCYRLKGYLAEIMEA